MTAKKLQCRPFQRSEKNIVNAFVGFLGRILHRCEHLRLSTLLRLNSPIVKAHSPRWLWHTSHSRLESFRYPSRMLRPHHDGILTWPRLRITNGIVEGLNHTSTASAIAPLATERPGRITLASITAVQASHCRVTFGRGDAQSRLQKEQACAIRQQYDTIKSLGRDSSKRCKSIQQAGRFLGGGQPSAATCQLFMCPFALSGADDR